MNKIVIVARFYFSNSLFSGGIVANSKVAIIVLFRESDNRHFIWLLLTKVF